MNPVTRAMSRWHVAFAAAFMNAVQSGSFFFTPTTLMPLIVADFSIPISLSTVPIAVGKIAYVLLLIPGGIVVDLYGPRICVMLGIFGLALVLTVYVLIISNLSSQLLAHVAMAVFASVSGVPVYSIFIAQWFTDNIGLAMGLVLAGFSAAGTTAPLILSPIAAAMGWRTAMACVCAVLWFVALPTSYFFLHEHHDHRLHQQINLDAHNQRSQLSPVEPPIPLQPLVSQHSFTFVGFALSYILLQYCFGCFGENIMFYLTIDGSLSLSFASLFFSALNLASFSAKLVGGHLGDHFDRFHVAAVSSAIAAIGITFLFNFGAGLDDNYLPHLSGSALPVLIFAILFGFGYGATFNSLYALTPIVFGKQNLGRTQSTLFGLGLCGNAVGSVLTGVLRSKYGTYQLPFFITALVCTLNFFVFNLTRMSLGGSVSAMKLLAEQRSSAVFERDDEEGSATFSTCHTPVLPSSASFSRMSPMLGSAVGPKGSPFSAERYDEQVRAMSTYDSIEMLPTAHVAISRSSSRYGGTGMLPERGYPIVRDWSSSSLRSQLQGMIPASPYSMGSVRRGTGGVGGLRKSSTFEAMIDSGILSASMEAVGYLGTNEATLRVNAVNVRTPAPSPPLRSTPARSPTPRQTPSAHPPMGSTATSAAQALLPLLPTLSPKTQSDGRE
eukprot:TRINITY_DN2939_c0_g1_i1.p1 TRINITY_DN2939_c0_g1~~TRINITY_DN2939_c0_g1_i1.p1  ORF type:complete len:668 (-),score=114.28 TRINITY_DN2939_c0_g1_i1:5470-7473(-)